MDKNECGWKHTDMRVELVSCSTDPDRLVACAGRVCYSDRPFEDIEGRMTDREVARMVENLHGSPMEHAVFTFYIEGVSRVLLAQLTRHRLASYSVQSQRYVDKSAEHHSWFVLPPSIEAVLKTEASEGDTMDDRPVTRALEGYWKALEGVQDVFKDIGLVHEDARYFDPQGIPTRLLWTVNARELMHVFGLRCCNRAQWEIRALAEKVVEKVRPVAPGLFDKAGAQCMMLGYCPEPKGCGRMPTLTECLGQKKE